MTPPPGHCNFDHCVLDIADQLKMGAAQVVLTVAEQVRRTTRHETVTSVTAAAAYVLGCPRCCRALIGRSPQVNPTGHFWPIGPTRSDYQSTVRMGQAMPSQPSSPRPWWSRCEPTFHASAARANKLPVQPRPRIVAPLRASGWTGKSVLSGFCPAGQRGSRKQMAATAGAGFHPMAPPWLSMMRWQMASPTLQPGRPPPATAARVGPLWNDSGRCWCRLAAIARTTEFACHVGGSAGRCPTGIEASLWASRRRLRERIHGMLQVAMGDECQRIFRSRVWCLLR